MLDREGRVLLVRFDDPPPMGVHWCTPGGGIEPGETEREGAARELREETGLMAEIGEELGRTVRVVHRVPGDGPVTQSEVHYAVRLDQAQPPVDESGHAVDQIAAWGWFDPDALPASTLPVELPDLLERVRRER